MFVPIIIPQTPSRKAQDLGHKVAELVRIYREEDPGLNLTDVKQAFGVAENEVRSDFGGIGANLRLVMVLCIGLLMAGLLAFLFFARSNDLNPQSLPVVLIALVVAGVAVLVITLFAVKR